MKHVLPVAAFAFLCSLTACSDKSSTLTTGRYRAVLQTPGGELPFGLDIQPVADKEKTYTVFAVNGSERLPMDTATVQGDSLHIPIALFESELVAKIDGNTPGVATLRGVYRRNRVGLGLQTLPFEAEQGLAYRFTKDEPTTTNVSGKWATQFESKTGKVDSINAVGIFEQNGNRVTGTFLTPTGDYRYLDGNVVGDSLFLSCFDGSHLFLFKARQDAATKTMTGGFWSGVSDYESWVARFDPKAELPDPGSLTYLKPGAKTLNISLPEPDGTLVSLTDPRFKGKVTIVQLLGSWCPNCMDETKFLIPWYQKNKQRGVEVLGLAFERSPEMAVSGPKIERMKERFQIDYPIVLAGSNDKAEASKALPDLNAVLAFPTTIFIDKKGKVRHIHTGFSGPGTGKYYDQYVEEFNRLVDKLLSEPGFM
ncbi:TlpA disulfide reductase family protein [Spirosoma spitsbergense]|jgi:thiol-disulfide isomerase/thioredoxin|uniref:TlpA disulfide reductase family protein n=1 Tax=Spirosoma spitsbergense TaxID=431554 RepID=UPI00036E31F5|nr:TlpA disulfide reductase family protein [Spirosoma spitsbergense]